jgi:hypothetical protein
MNGMDQQNWPQDRPSGPLGQSIWLPGKWPSLNSLLFTKVRDKIRVKAAWQDSTRLLIRVSRLRPLGRVFLHYEHHRPDWRGDPDNFAAAAAKVVTDALVEEGVLAGDTFRTVMGFSHTFMVDKAKPGIRVTLEERSAH